MSRKTTKQRECTECGNKVLVHDSETGEIICVYCGLVLGKDNISRQQEEYTEVLHKGKGTEIGLILDSRGRSVLPSFQIKRLKKYQRQVAESRETRSLRIAKPKLQRIIDKLHLPSSVKELATTIYKMASEQNLIRRKTVIGIVSASIYFACRLLKIPRRLSEFSEITGFSKKELGGNYRFLHRELADKLNQKLDIKVQAPNYLQLIDPITENLQISTETAQLATKIIKAAEKKKLTQGRTPGGIAAAAIYIACGLMKEKRIQLEIATQAQTTEMTLRNRASELREKLVFETSL